MKDLEQTFYNASGETIPPFGIVEITDDHSVAGRKVLNGVKPSQGLGTNPYARFRVNGPYEVPSGKTGRCYAPWVEGYVKYDTTDPISNGDVWGPASGSFELTKDKEGFIATGDGDSDRGIVLAKYNVTQGDSGDTSTGASCNCRDCIDRRFLTVDFGGTVPALEAYSIGDPDDAGSTSLVYVGGGVWESDTFSQVCGPSDSISVHYTLTATGNGPGDAVIQLINEDDGDAVIAEWQNLETGWLTNCTTTFGLIPQAYDCGAFNPFCKICLFAKRYDGGCTCNFHDYVVRVDLGSLSLTCESGCAGANTSVSGSYICEANTGVVPPDECAWTARFDGHVLTVALSIANVLRVDFYSTDPVYSPDGIHICYWRWTYNLGSDEFCDADEITLSPVTIGSAPYRCTPPASITVTPLVVP